MLKEMHEVIEKSDLSTYDKMVFKERITRTYHSFMLEVDKRENLDVIDKSSLSTGDKAIFKDFYLKTYNDYVQRTSYGVWLPADTYTYSVNSSVSPVLEELGIINSICSKRDKDGYLEWYQYVIFPGSLVRLTAAELAERLKSAQELSDKDENLTL